MFRACRPSDSLSPPPLLSVVPSTSFPEPLSKWGDAMVPSPVRPLATVPTKPLWRSRDSASSTAACALHFLPVLTATPAPDTFSSADSAELQHLQMRLYRHCIYFLQPGLQALLTWCCFLIYHLQDACKSSHPWNSRTAAEAPRG